MGYPISSHRHHHLYRYGGDAFLCHLMMCSGLCIAYNPLHLVFRPSYFFLLLLTCTRYPYVLLVSVRRFSRNPSAVPGTCMGSGARIGTDTLTCAIPVWGCGGHLTVDFIKYLRNFKYATSNTLPSSHFLSPSPLLRLQSLIPSLIPPCSPKSHSFHTSITHSLTPLHCLLGIDTTA